MIQLFENLRDDIIRRGISATLDPRDMSVPGAIITLDQIGNDVSLCGDPEITASVMLVASDSGHPHAMKQLLDMYDQVKDLTTGATATTFTWSEIPNLPALQLNPIPIGE